MTFLRRHWPLILPALFALAVYRAWVGPGLLIGDDFYRFSGDVLRSYFPWKTAWDSSFAFGVSTATTAPEYPLWSLAGLLTRAGASFALTERIVWFWPLLVLLVAAPYAFAYRITGAPLAAALASAVFAVNTWTVALVQRGHIPSLVAYSFMPLAVLACGAWLRAPTWRRSVWLSALLTVQVVYDLRYAFITGLLCAIVIACELVRDRRAADRPTARGVLAGMAMAAGAFAVLNLYWIVPQFFAPASLPQGYDTLASFVSASSFESLPHALALFMPYYHYKEGSDPFFVWPVEPAFFLIPAAAALSLLAARKSPYAMPIAVAALAGVIVTAGPGSPTGVVISWAFVHVPGMSLFRDISKFTALVAFAYSAAIAMGFGSFAAWLKGRVRAPGAATAACALLLLAGYALLMRDAFDPERFSNFAVTGLSSDDLAMQRFLDGQTGYFRTLMFPMWRSEIVGTDEHPLVSAAYLFDSAGSDQGAGDLFDSSWTLQRRMTSPLVPALLAEGGVRYVVLIEDRRGDVYTPSEFDVQYAQMLHLLRTLPWLNETAQLGRYTVFSLKPPAPRAFFAADPAVVGTDPRSIAAFAASPWWAGWPALIAADPGALPGLRQPVVRAIVSRADGVASESFSIGTAERDDVWLHARSAPEVADKAASEFFTSASALVSERPWTLQHPPYEPIAVEADDKALMSAPFPSDDPRATWLGLTSERATVHVVNLRGQTVYADVTLRIASPDGRPRTVVASLNGLSNGITVRSDVDAAGTLLLPNVVLYPGENDLRLRVAGERSDVFFALVRDDIAVGVQLPEAAEHEPAKLTVAVRATQTGVVAGARLARASERYEEAAWPILAAPTIPLDEHPIIMMGYRAPATPLTLALALRLIRTSSGRASQIEFALPPSMHRTSIDVFALVQQALDDGFALIAKRNAGDPVWQRLFGRVGPEASAYELSGVQLKMLAPRGTPAGDYAATLSDARLEIDAPVQMPFPVAHAQPIDLRGATASAGESFAAPQRIAVQSDKSAALQIRVPVAPGPQASMLVFWAGTSPDAISTSVRLGFSRAGAPQEVVVQAAGRPSMTDPDSPLPPEWVSDAGPSDGNGLIWRRYDIDVDEVKAYRLPGAGAGFSLAALQLVFTPSDTSAGPERVAVADATLAGGPHDGGIREPGFALDREPTRMLSWQPDGTGGLRSQVSGVALHAGMQRITLPPPVTIDVDGAVVAPAAQDQQKPPPVVSFTELSSGEYETRSGGTGGLFVLSQAFAPGWRLSEANTDGALSGYALIDWWRLRKNFIPTNDHVAANTVFNAWVVPPGSLRLVALYVPEALSEGCALIWLAGSLAVVSTALARRRPYKR